MKKLSYLLLLAHTLIFLSCTEKEEIITPEPINEEVSLTNLNRQNLPTRTLENLRYNQIQYKGSHNSYERNEAPVAQLGYSFPRYNDNCMPLEFDIWRNTPRSPYTQTNVPGNLWVIAHRIHPGRNGRYLSSDLYHIKRWSDNNPNHWPVMIKLDIKSGNGGYQDFDRQIDLYLRRFLGSNKVFKASDLFKDPQRSLRHNVRFENAWPKMKDLKGKFIIVLTGNRSWIDQYAKTTPNNNLAFSMKLVAPPKGVVTTSRASNSVPSNVLDARKLVDDNPYYAFYNISMSEINDRRNNYTDWARELARLGMVTRVFSANKQKDWHFLLHTGISCISTNKIRNNDWATVAPRQAWPFIRRF